MRITSNSLFSRYSSILNDLQEQQARENTRIYTGKSMVNLSDDPSVVKSIQVFTESINKNDSYQKSIEEMLDEQTSTENALRVIADSLDEAQGVGNEALQIGNQDKLPVLGEKIKKLLNNIVDTANHQYNGVYVFSGTRTTEQSLNPTPPEQKNLPFEIIQGTATTANPSGLSVSFKGNNEVRNISVGPNASERINTTAADAFGGSGTEVFGGLIELYNKLMFNADGTPRAADGTGTTKDDQDAIVATVKRISDSRQLADVETGKLGARSQRLESLRDQLTTDTLRLREFRSREEDTDVAEAVVNLQKSQNAMQYALQVGSKLLGQSLFDFLR